MITGQGTGILTCVALLLMRVSRGVAGCGAHGE
jgi:hypothetical protein